MTIKNPFIMMLIFFFALAGASLSQTPCTRNDALNKPGIWVRQKVDDLALPDPTFSQADFPQILAKAQQTAELIKKAAPDITGLSASLQRSIRGKSYFKNGALPFSMSARFNDYYCVSNEPGVASEIRGSIQLNPEKSARIQIFFNTLGWITNSDQDTDLATVDNQNIYYYPSSLPDFKGVSAFFPEVANQANEMYVVAPDGKNPFVILSREDYILARRKKMRAEIERSNSAAAGQSKENEAMLAKIDSNPLYTAEQKKQFRQAIEKTKPSLNAMSAKMLQQFEEWDKAFEKLLQEMSPAERREPAIIKNPSSFPPKDKIFYTEQEGGRKLFTVSKDFFNPSAPRQNVQLITIYLFWDAKHPPETRVINQFKENFDFQAVRRMLEK